MSKKVIIISIISICLILVLIFFLATKETNNYNDYVNSQESDSTTKYISNDFELYKGFDFYTLEDTIKNVELSNLFSNVSQPQAINSLIDCYNTIGCKTVKFIEMSEEKDKVYYVHKLDNNYWITCTDGYYAYTILDEYSSYEE